MGRSWHVDETYIRVGGVWKYLYRGIDRDGNLVDSMLSEHRDMDAAKRFFKGVLEMAEQVPDRVTTDGHDSYPRAIRETLGGGVKQRYDAMRGFGSFDAASRFCRAFDEQRQFFRIRTTMRQHLPPLSEQRREFRVRWTELVSNLMAA